MVEACKGCGFPANKYWPPKQRPIIVYCGKEECLNKLVRLHKPKPAIVKAIEKTTGITKDRKDRDEEQAIKERLQRDLGYCC